MLRQLIAVFVGGLVGTGIRFALDATLPRPDGFPLSTLIINIVGALVLGMLVARVWPTAPAWLRAGLGTGVLGSFTTFSAFAVGLAQLPLGLSALYAVLTLVLGFAAAFAGLALGSRRAAGRIDLGHE